jgi:glyoxylase-like metal-dependent hydrolase (beta-lactamase superfamily II)
VLEIIPLHVGRITQVERSGQQYLTGAGERIEVQCLVWLLRGGSQTIIVDAGSGTAELVEQRFGREMKQTRDQRPEVALANAGVRPEDVDVLILTHLHWDHALSLDEDLYPNATIYLQQSELRYAGAPYPVHAGMYDRRVVQKFVPSFRREQSRVKVLRGDAKIAPDVSVMWTPGHSPGLQAVLVETASGRVALASDNVPFFSSYTGPTLEDWIPPGIHVNLDDYYASNARLAAAADLILPSHDPLILDQEVYR